jgi:transglutaminase-like putative cysteine protease/predicted glutamine amidotransferase
MLLLLNSDALTSPSIKLKPPHLQSHRQFSWGFGWYPNDNQAAMIAKDPASHTNDVVSDALSDWSSFRSTVFYSKVIPSSNGYSHHEAQPFSRSYAGRDWVFVHNGDLDRNKLQDIVEENSKFLEPLGKTDSELAFCFLLAKIMVTDARKLIEVPNKTILNWFRQLDPLGNADISLTDGMTMLTYHGKNSPKSFFYTRISPPGHPTHFDSTHFRLSLNDPRDTYRTTFMISSEAFKGGAWSKMIPGQLLITRYGNIIWDNMGTSTPQKEKIVPVPPPLIYSATNLSPMSSQQTQQTFQSVVNARSITHTTRGKPLTYRMFDVSHITHYHYDKPVEHSTHTFRLQPREDSIQEVVHSNINISVQGEAIRFEDVFGNNTLHYTIDTPYTDLKIQSISRVKIYETPPDDLSLSLRKGKIPLVWMPWQRQMLLPYRQPIELPETQLRELTEYAMSFVNRNDGHPINTIKDINSTIYNEYAYVPGSTTLDTNAFEVYSQREGVCQDFANLLICLARLLNIPARYCMGYIYTGVNYANKIQSDASHAWVEVYFPYLGWRGFDPTNGCMVSKDHIRIACGRHYVDATPTNGTIFKGGGDETLKAEVKMVEIK